MEKRTISKVFYALSNWHDFRLKIFTEGIIIGLVAGIITVLFRYSITKAESLHKVIFAYLHANPILFLFLVCILFLLAFILGHLLKYEPQSAGSGIPQVKGVILGMMKMNWQKVLATKFFGGILALGSGLSLGREGPSIQLGAVIGQGISRLLGRTRMEERYLLTSGASAGLAAAFNAPLAGVIFALEELHKNFSSTALMSAMAASITADLVSRLFFGPKSVFNFEGLPILPVNYYGHMIILGIISGFGGVLFNKYLIKSLNYFDNQRIVPKTIQAIIPLLMGWFIGFFLPGILGGGNDLISDIVAGHFSLIMLLLLLVLKFSFTIISYGSGVPGGIFLPLLVTGALVGGAFGNICTEYLYVDSLYTNNFVVLSMAAFFTAIVKAPITGSVLIVEMTGSFNHLLPLITISMTAHLITDLAKSKPVYEELLDRSLNKQKLESLTNSSHDQVITELAVCVGSKLDGKKIKDIAWPEGTLLVNIKRGETEIVPKGNIRIIAGDYLFILINQNQTFVVSELAGECTP